MNIYRRLNPKLLVQVEADLGLLHWTNISNITLTPINKNKNKNVVSIFKNKLQTLR